jgi:hypothetical protein
MESSLCLILRSFTVYLLLRPYQLGPKKKFPLARVFKWEKYNKSNVKIFSCAVGIKSFIVIEGNYLTFYPAFWTWWKKSKNTEKYVNRNYNLCLGSFVLITFLFKKTLKRPKKSKNLVWNKLQKKIFETCLFFLAILFLSICRKLSWYSDVVFSFILSSVHSVKKAGNLKKN